MNQYVRRVLWLLFAMTLTTVTAFGQGYPLPSKTPRTTVPCPGCSTSLPDGKTVGYEPGMTFTGRYLDSTHTSDIQGTFRTARAASVSYFPAAKRIYVRIGSSVASYDRDTFFQRLEVGEQLWPSTAVPVSPGNQRFGANGPEVFLKWDTYFYPEWTPAAKWTTPKQDGQDRIVGFDVDDEGYVYIAATVFGWGIVKDVPASGGLMTPVVQLLPGSKDPTPTRIMTLKGSSRYAFVSGDGKTVTWDVSTRGNPTQFSMNPFFIQTFAKTPAQDKVGLTTDAGYFMIYTADGLANRGAALVTEDSCRGAATDGTNFYTIKLDPTAMKLLVFTPNGNGTYTRNEYATGAPFRDVASLKVNDGFAVVTGLDMGASYDVRVMKLNNLVPTVVPLTSFPADSTYPSYFRSYYYAPPAGYVRPELINIIDGEVIQSNGRNYLMICGYGLGDVYELPAGATINITKDSPVGSVNPNAPAASNTTTYYGDPVRVTGTSTTTVSQIQWNFGNPENTSAGVATANQQSSSTAVPIVYQYAGLNASNLGARTITATSADDPKVKGTSSVTLVLPQARFGIAGTSFLFTQPNASSPAPIVVGDSFVDASDGRVEGHYSTWTVDGVTTNAVPYPNPVSVGGCGTHSLNFTANYGPYSTPGTTTGGAPLALSINGTNYGVRPYAASVDLVPAVAGATSLTFRSSSRASTDQNALPSAIAAGLTYKFELVDANNNVITGVPPGVGGGVPTSAVTFQVPKNMITSPDMRVRLTITSPTTLPGGCAGFENSVAYSTKLNGPDPAPIAPSGSCDAGSPCTFTVNSLRAGFDTIADGWTYQWQVLNTAGTPDSTAFSAPSITDKTFAPKFLKAGTWTVRANVSNAIGTSFKDYAPLTITTPASVCVAMTDSNMAISAWLDNGATCGGAINCTAQNVNFAINAPLGSNYDVGCSPHTFAWTFGDGGTADTQTPSHTFANGTYNVSVTVRNSSGDQHVYALSVTVGTYTPPPPPPPTQDPCTQITQNNFNTRFDAMSGGSGCSAANGNTCKNNETLTFTAGYTGTCTGLTYTWNFNDGSALATGPSATHSFGTTGQHLVNLAISTPLSGGIQKTLLVSTSDQTNPGGNGQCGQLVEDYSLWVDYANSTNTCTPFVAGGCKASDALTFTVKDAFPYSIGCATHTFNWDFGDNSTHLTTRDAIHTYQGKGTYNVTCQVSNGSAQATLHATIIIGDGGSAQKPDVTVDFTASALSQATGAYVYLFNPNATPDGIVTKYSWNYGDGKSETLNAPGITSHLYPDGSKHTVTVTAYDAQGNTWTHTEEVPMTLPRRRGVRH